MPPSSTNVDAASRGRDNNFDFLRFLFATSVLFYHCYSLLLGSGPRRRSFDETLASLAGSSSVDFFFVISGFLVLTSWVHSQGVRQYLKKRVLRIYPAFVLASFFCAFVAGPLGVEDLSRYWHHFKFLKFTFYLFLLPADVVGPDMAQIFDSLPFPHVIDGSFWTLRYEFGMYLLVVALGTLGLFQPARKAWVVILLGGLYFFYAVSQRALLQVVCSREFPLVGNPSEWLRLSVFFLIGMAVYLYRKYLPLTPALAVISAATLLWLTQYPGGFNMALPILGSYLLFFVAFQPQIKMQKFARHGDFSYGLYLFAFPIQQLLIFYFGKSLSVFTLFLLLP